MKNALYWTALLIGIVIVFLIHNKYSPNSLENFQSNSTTAPYSEVSDTTFPSQFVGYTNTTTNKIFAYLSAFSDKTSTRVGGSAVDTYDVATNKWRDLINTNDFTLSTMNNTISLPSSLTNTSTNWKGLATSNIAFYGPRSEMMSTDFANNVFTMASFSVCFYMKWNTLNPSSTSDIILFEMYAENPNYICWRLREIDTNNVSMQVILGDASTIHKWTVQKASFMANGQPCIYTLTYDQPNKTIMIYIGISSVYRKVLTDTPSIKLANTNMMINSNNNMDGVVSAFVLYKDLVLTASDVQKLNLYFMNKATGSDQAIAAANAVAAEATTQYNTVLNQLSDTQTSLEDLQSRLQTCIANSSNVVNNDVFRPVSKYSKWSVSLGSDVDELVSNADLKKCSALKIQDFGDAKQTSPLERQIPPELAANYSPRKPFDNYDIRNPTKPSNSVSTVATTPSASTTASSPASSSSSSSTSMASPASSVSSSSNNTVTSYSSSYDRTQPGSAALIPPPPTTASAGVSVSTSNVATTAPVQQVSLWEFIMNMF